MPSCPACGTAHKSGSMFSSANAPVYEHDERYQFVRFFWNRPEKVPVEFCEQCINGLVGQIRKAIDSEANSINKFIMAEVNYVPVLSIHHPVDWKYHALGIVTGQSVTGTGVFSDLSADWNDFWGTQSNTLAAKIKLGEKTALAQLRSQAMRMGGNAVIGVDLDYSEVGSLRGMMMVCATGTAVNITNPEILGSAFADRFAVVAAKIERYKFLQPYLSH